VTEYKFRIGQLVYFHAKRMGRSQVDALSGSALTKLERLSDIQVGLECDHDSRRHLHGAAPVRLPGPGFHAAD
jgi:hypothetical protein